MPLALPESWSPGRLPAGGRDSNPAGKEFQKSRLKPPFRAMRNTDYAANFDDFLGQVKGGSALLLLVGHERTTPGIRIGRGQAGRQGSRQGHRSEDLSRPPRCP